MLDVLVNHKLKTICLTYPKGASTSLRSVLLPRFDNQDNTLNEFNQEWTLHSSINNGEIHTHLANYEDYTIYAFCREPVDRWATGLLFMMHTHWDLFYSDISNAGQDIVDNASDEYLRQLVSTIVSINNQRCDFNDVHMWRPLFTLLQIKILNNDRVHLMPLSLMDQVLCDIHSVPRQTFPRENTSDDGYEPGHGHHDNSAFIAKLHTRWKQVIVNAVEGRPEFTSVKDYLSIEDKVYKQVVIGGHDVESVFSQIITDGSCKLASGYFIEDMASYKEFVALIGRDSKVRDIAITNSYNFLQ